MTDAAHPWVEVAWDVIEAGDHVRTPDGAAWHVTAKVDVPGDGLLSLLIALVGREETEVWTDRPRGAKVMAWRFRDAPPLPGAEAFAIGRLRLGGFDVSTVDG